MFLSGSDVKRIVQKLTRQYFLPPEFAQKLFAETLRFLEMCAVYQKNFTPSPGIDLAWHSFLLYSHAYQDFCKALGVEFLHHEPGDQSERMENESVAETIRFMEQKGIPFHKSIWKPGTNNTERRNLCFFHSRDLPFDLEYEEETVEMKVASLKH